MSELSRCSTCGYRWVSAGWTCPRCGYAPQVSRTSGGYDSAGDEPGCTEYCLFPLGCVAALIVVPMLLLGGLALAAQWQTWVVVGMVVAVAGGVALFRYLQHR